MSFNDHFSRQVLVLALPVVPMIDKQWSNKIFPTKTVTLLVMYHSTMWAKITLNKSKLFQDMLVMILERNLSKINIAVFFGWSEILSPKDRHHIWWKNDEIYTYHQLFLFQGRTSTLPATTCKFVTPARLCLSQKETKPSSKHHTSSGAKSRFVRFMEGTIREVNLLDSREF